MNKGVQAGLLLMAGLLIGVFARRAPTPVTIRPPAVVIHDTVTKMVYTQDTITITKNIEKLHVDTLWRVKETTAPAETLRVVPELFGVTAFKAGQRLGDTTTFVGFHLKPDSMMTGEYTINGWMHQDITPGPVDGFIMYGDGTLKAGYDPHGFPVACSVRDNLKWAGIGAGGITLLRAVLGR